MTELEKSIAALMEQRKTTPANRYSQDWENVLQAATAYSEMGRDDREKLATFMLDNGIATGHGDTIDDLLIELGGFIKEQRGLIGGVPGGLSREDLSALAKFKERFPTWWYKIGVCDLTRDFDCAPQGHSPETKYIEQGIWADDCFSCDHKGTLADAINDVIEQITAAEGVRDGTNS